MTVRGTFHSEGPHVSMMLLRHKPSGANLRWLVELVSLIVLAGVLWNFWRKFSIHPEAIRVGKAS